MSNLFPCLVTTEDGQRFDTCRVISGTNGTTVYWWDREIGDARPVISSPFGLEANAPGSRNYTLGMEEGPPVSVIRLTGCGCGHPMKRWRLPKPVIEAG